MILSFWNYPLILNDLWGSQESNPRMEQEKGMRLG